MAFYPLVISSGDPTTFQEAVNGPGEKWMGGCYGRRDGVLAQESNVGFDGASREEEGDRVQVGVKKKEAVSEKEGEKFKACLVARDYSQQKRG
jgi:hypothetical protein